MTPDEDFFASIAKAKADMDEARRLASEATKLAGESCDTAGWASDAAHDLCALMLDLYKFTEESTGKHDILLERRLRRGLQ